MPMVFRSPAFWQSALMTLPDDAFFELYRSVLGTVKTPFNKQSLLEELSRFVTRPEIQETIAAYIDMPNRRIITAVALLGEPVPGELESFFTGEYNYAELHSILLNLEERLIIYRFRDGDKLRLALNPRLENVLSPLVSDPLILFPSIAAEPDTDANAASPVNSRILAAVFAYLLNGEALFKGDTQGSFSLRKKTLDEGSRLFPSLDFESIVGGFISLGLLVQNEEYLEADEAKLAVFKTLSLQDCFEYVAAGIALFLQRGFSCPNRSLLKNTARMVHSLMAYTGKEGRLLPEATMIKLAEMLRREEEKSWGSMGTSNAALWSSELPSSSMLIQSLVPAGLFTITAFKGKNCYRPVLQNISEASAGTPEHPLIAMDSGFSCILYPEISFADAMDLGAFSGVEETGTTVRFVLSRDSVVRGFNRGYGADFLWQLLERLSAGRAGDALQWNLKDWEKRYREVSLDEGTVLTLSGERSYLAQTEPLASMISKTLGPGIYLLSAAAGEASDALHKAGVDIVARFRGGKAGQPQSFPSLEEFPPAPLPEVVGEVSGKAPDSTTAAAAEDTAEQSKERFRNILAGMNLSKQEKEELESRIERGVVVSEAQLKAVSLRYEKLEARSLDYVGKTGIAKQAIASGSLLEVHWTAAASAEQKLLGVPESLEKKGGEMILVIKPREGGESIRIALGKISLLRRIKQSIFGE